MLDDNQDKGLQRKQLIGFLLIGLVLMLWLPTAFPPPKQPSPEQLAESPPAAPVTPVTETPPGGVPGLLSLPPVAGLVALPDDEITLWDDYLELVFTRVGARLKRATVLLGENGDNSVQLVPESPETPDPEAIYPLGLRFSEELLGQPFLGEKLDVLRWDRTSDASARSVAFSLEMPGLARVTKTFSFSEAPYVLDVSVAYTNLEDSPRILGVDTKELAYSLTWGPNVDSGDERNRMIQQEVLWRKEGANEHHVTAKLEPPISGSAYSERAIAPDFLAVKSAYFVVAMKPEYEDAEAWAIGGVTPGQFQIGIGVPRTVLDPEAVQTNAFKIYLGPNQGSSLRAAWPELEEVLEYFTSVKFMDAFSKLLLGIMNWFHNNIIANYGWAIIFLTVIVRVTTFPLTLKSMKSMKMMQKLQPEMKKLKEECGDNQQEMQRKMMELYKERGVNPFGGCLPMLLQMPVFFALYRMVASAFELRGAHFMFWIADLSQPDALMELPIKIPIPFAQLPISTLNLLPILMGVAMYASQKIMPTSGPSQNPQQKMIMTMMPIMMIVIFYNMAAGLNLYFLTSTLLGIVQNHFIRVSDEELKPKKKKAKTAGKPKHFYAAAQARKRAIAKETRRDKRTKPTGTDSKKKKKRAAKRR